MNTTYAYSQGRTKNNKNKKLASNPSDTSAIIDKAAPARDIFDIKHFYTIWPQFTWQFITKIRRKIAKRRYVIFNWGNATSLNFWVTA